MDIMWEKERYRIIESELELESELESEPTNSTKFIYPSTVIKDLSSRPDDINKIVDEDYSFV